MKLPLLLRQAIEQIMETSELRSLTEAREELTRRYRDPFFQQKYMSDDTHRQAYLITRLPATYAAIYTALKAILKQLDPLPIKSLLDLGSGPGTAMWAACELFNTLEKATLIDRDESLIIMGKQLAQASDHQAIKESHWEVADLKTYEGPLPSHDLIVLSYLMGELDARDLIKILEQSWQATEQLLVIIEPGTPKGFERIRMIRQQLIDWGAHLVAPCPHQLKCPMEEGDWCHFSARIERSSLHRQLKKGHLGYEDEKFSYIAAAKVSFSFPHARVIRHPIHHSGHSQLKLCTQTGIENPIISKKNKANYRQARKADWGDFLNFLL